jgi:hypothetical protein
VKAALALLAVLAASPAYAASDAYCARWALETTLNSDHPKPTIDAVQLELSRAWSVCLNSDMDPTAGETPASVAAATEAAVTGTGIKLARLPVDITPPVKPPKAMAVQHAGPGCRRYRTYDPRRHTVLGYHHRVMSCP